MTPFTSNYETIKDSSLEDKSLDTPSQSKIQSTFLQSVLSNKLVVAFVVVVLGTGLMAYNTNPVPPSNQFRLGEYAQLLMVVKVVDSLVQKMGVHLIVAATPIFFGNLLRTETRARIHIKILIKIKSAFL